MSICDPKEPCLSFDDCAPKQKCVKAGGSEVWTSNNPCGCHKAPEGNAGYVLNEDCECELVDDQSITYTLRIINQVENLTRCSKDEQGQAVCGPVKQKVIHNSYYLWPYAGFGPCQIRVPCGGSYEITGGGTKGGTPGLYRCARTCGFTTESYQPKAFDKDGVEYSPWGPDGRLADCIMNFNNTRAGVMESYEVVILEVAPCSLGCV